MQLISRIEISYFRSAYSITLADCKDINVLLGGNDAGKSNVLKALNLFFNNETDLGAEYSFLQDITKFRLEEASEAKGRASIWIKVTFNNVFGWGSLPAQFTIKKSWNRYSTQPERTWSPQKYKNKKILEQTVSKLLNKISFHYVPAVKGRHIFSYYLGKVYDALLDDVKVELSKSTKVLVQDLEKAVEDMAVKIKKDLKFDSTIRVPSDFRLLFESLDFSTKLGEFDIPLQHRGDGIQARHIPYILDFIASKSKKHHIWAYEEPENSLEMSKAFELAELFKRSFSKENQIFLTTHSPAFYDLDGDRVAKWLVKTDHYKEDASKRISTTVSLEKNQIADEVLGIAALVKARAKEAYEDLEQSNSLLEKLKEKVSAFELPSMIVEGKFDKVILEEAWKKLYGDTIMPFNIVSYSDDPNSDKGGVVAVTSYLNSVLPSETTVKIGVYDRDDAGVNCYNNKLDVYKKITSVKDVKQHSNTNAYAVLLPEIEDGTEDYWDKKKPCIEFLFAKKYLTDNFVSANHSWKGRPLNEKEYLSLMENKEFKNTIETVYTVKQGLTKKHFAENKVKTFPKDAFKNFDIFFERVLLLLK